MAPPPRVTVGMPVYNEERHLDAAIEAVLAQSLSDIEVVISDNASTDRTEAICRAWAARDSRIRYLRAAENQGANVNFNRVFTAGRGKYFVWASGHDLRGREFLARCVEVLEREPSVVLCYPEATWVDEHGAPIEPVGGAIDSRGRGQLARVRHVLWNLGFAFQIYGVIRADALRRTRLMGRIVGGDVLLLAELSLLGAIAGVPEPLLYVRRLPDYGDWNRYLEKSLGADATRRSAWNLYAAQLREYWRAIDWHVERLPRKAALMVLVTHTLLTKYRFVLQGLRQRT